MNKSDLIKRISNKTNSLDHDDASQSVDAILTIITNSLSMSNRVEIRNFGTFSTRLRGTRLSRNPKIGTSVLVEAKRHPYFRAAKYLRESLNK